MTMIAWDKDTAAMGKHFLKGNYKTLLVLGAVMTLIAVLATVMLVLLHTNEEIKRLQNQVEYAPVDYSVGGLSLGQVEALKKDTDVAHVSVQQGESYGYIKGEETVFLIHGDNHLMTMTSKLVEGRYPERPGEVVAEKWMLSNLGIVPEIGSAFELESPDTGKIERFCVTGILSDIYRNKKAGLLELYTAMSDTTTTQQSYTAYVKFDNGVTKNEKMSQLQSALEINQKQIVENPSEVQQNAFKRLCIEIILLMLVVGLVMFYGVYRIGTISRLSHYGLLRAVGVTKNALRRMIVLEVLGIYLCFVPIGVLLGALLANGILTAAGDFENTIYLYNECVDISLIVPWPPLGGFLILLALGVGLIVVGMAYQVTEKNIISMIDGQWREPAKNRRHFSLEYANGKTSTCLRMGWKYIIFDAKTSFFMVLVMSLSIVIFVGLVYEAKIAETFRTDTKEMYYLNGNYVMSMLHYDNVDEGVSRTAAKKIATMSGVEGVKTSSAIPIRVIDDKKILRNDEYYKEHNRNLEKIYGYGDEGFDGKEYVYKSKLCGYNDNALRALENYVIEGNFTIDSLKDDEVILSVFSMADKNNKGTPGHFKNGVPLMNYHVGDKIVYKYREDLHTDSMTYENLKDTNASYCYKTMKIKAIVSFPYILDSDRTVYPLLITKDAVIEQIAPSSAFQCIYIDALSKENSTEQIALEKQLIEIGSRFSVIVTRSLDEEIEQNEKLFQKRMVYLYSVAVACLILMVINIITNLRYRMKMRSQEVCMLRAIGVSVKMLRKMLFFENLTLGLLASGCASILAPPVLKFLYHRSMMALFSHPYSFQVTSFLIVAMTVIAICVMLSMRLLEEWKMQDVVSGIVKYD